ncbi:MAG: lipase family protein, partial [Terriglobia bacterium]
HPESTQGINPYSYVENNPLNRTDPTGEVMDQCMANGICGSVTIDGIGTISAGGRQQQEAEGQSNTAPTPTPTGTTGANSTDGTNVSAHNFDNKTSDKDAAWASSCVYDTSCKGGGNWERTLGGLDPKMFNDPNSGFKAALFRNKVSGNYILAFAGVDGFTAAGAKDANASKLQYEGKDSPQFDEAVALTQAVKNFTRNASLTVTGHSLGGALAAVSALYGGIHGVTFNAEGLSKGTIARYGLEGAMKNADITAYHTALDPLTQGQGIYNIFHPSDKITVPGKSVNLWNGPYDSGHSMHSVCQAMDAPC